MLRLTSNPNRPNRTGLSSLLQNIPEVSFSKQLENIISVSATSHLKSNNADSFIFADFLKTNQGLPPSFEIILTDQTLKDLEQLAVEIHNHLKNTSDILSQVPVIDDIEWVFEGRSKVLSIASDIDKSGIVMWKMMSLLEHGKRQSYQRDLFFSVLHEIKYSVEDWHQVNKTTKDLRFKIDVSSAWIEFLYNVLQDVDSTISKCEDELFQVLENRLRVTPALSEFVSSLNDKSNSNLHSNLNDNEFDNSDNERKLDRLLEFLTYSELDKMVKYNNDNYIIPTFNSTERTFNESFIELITRLDPLKASIDFLPIPLNYFFNSATEIFPNSISTLNQRLMEVDEHWSLLQKDVKDLETDLVINKWETIFIFILDQLQFILNQFEKKYNQTESPQSPLKTKDSQDNLSILHHSHSLLSLKSIKTTSSRTKSPIDSSFSINTTTTTNINNINKNNKIFIEKKLRLVEKTQQESSNISKRFQQTMKILKYCLYSRKLIPNELDILKPYRDKFELIIIKAKELKLEENENIKLSFLWKHHRLQLQSQDQDQDQINQIDYDDEIDDNDDSMDSYSTSNSIFHSKSDSIETTTSTDSSPHDENTYSNDRLKIRRRAVGSLLMSKINDLIIPDTGVPLQQQNILDEISDIDDNDNKSEYTVRSSRSFFTFEQSTSNPNPNPKQNNNYKPYLSKEVNDTNLSLSSTAFKDSEFCDDTETNTHAQCLSNNNKIKRKPSNLSLISIGINENDKEEFESRRPSYSQQKNSSTSSTNPIGSPYGGLSSLAQARIPSNRSINYLNSNTNLSSSSSSSSNSISNSTTSSQPLPLPKQFQQPQRKLSEPTDINKKSNHNNNNKPQLQSPLKNNFIIPNNFNKSKNDNDIDIITEFENIKNHEIQSITEFTSNLSVRRSVAPPPPLFMKLQPINSNNGPQNVGPKPSIKDIQNSKTNNNNIQQQQHQKEYTHNNSSSSKSIRSSVINKSPYELKHNISHKSSLLSLSRHNNNNSNSKRDSIFSSKSKSASNLNLSSPASTSISPKSTIINSNYNSTNNSPKDSQPNMKQTKYINNRDSYSSDHSLTPPSIHSISSSSRFNKSLSRRSSVLFNMKSKFSKHGSVASLESDLITPVEEKNEIENNDNFDKNMPRSEKPKSVHRRKSIISMFMK